MENKRGMTISERLKQDIEYAENTTDIKHREILAIKALGAVDIAVEYGLITYKEWEAYLGRIFAII